jgi:hypothetical protein
MPNNEIIKVTNSDLLAAWAVLENLAVSFDQIGGSFAESNKDTNGAERQIGIQQALASYVTPELVKAINEARAGLGQYVSDEDAEDLTDRIPYWDYRGAPRLARKA